MPPAQDSTLGFARGPNDRWTRDGVFRVVEPLLTHSVRAKDVRALWSKGQQASFVPDLPDTPDVAAARTQSLVPIGGSYWSDTDFPVVGESTKSWVSSGFASMGGSTPPASLGGKAKGTMWTAPFVITQRYLRLQVGGDDSPGVGVEVLVERAPGDDLSACDQPAPKDDAGRAAPTFAGGEKFARVYVRRGKGEETVEPYEIQTDLPRCNLKGKRAVIRIFDASSEAHVNVGTIEASDVPLTEWEKAGDAPVWGFADFHTHPTSYLGFGGLQGIHTIWGSPGGRITDYVGRDKRKVIANMAHDVPPCDDPHKPFNAHHGGFAAPIMINAAEGRASESLADLSIPILGELHPSQGGPSYRDFPNFRSGSHQQYHISQIHRAYLGGLRLITALAVQNRGLEYGSGWAICGPDGKPTVETTDDLDLVAAHVEAMRQLVNLNHDWMQIAYTPLQAQQIIRANKLAVVLGVEVGQLGQSATRSIEQQVDDLAKLGIRHVILIHGMDNLLAGTAMFQDLYNTVSDWLNRDPATRDKVQPLSGELDSAWFGPEAFFEITTAPSPLFDDYSARRGKPWQEDWGSNPEPILFRLSSPHRIVLSDIFPHSGPLTYTVPFSTVPYGEVHPFVNNTPMFRAEQGVYDQYAAGHRNTRPLSGRGKEFIERLMARGMVIDLDHMSDQSVDGALETFDGHGCATYPFMVSHVHFRHLPFTGDYSGRASSFVARTSSLVKPDQSMSACLHDHAKCPPGVYEEAQRTRGQAPWVGPGSLSRDNLPNEFAIATPEIEEVAHRGGSIGVFVGQPPLDEAAFGHQPGGLPDGAASLPFGNDCASSSKGMATALWFAEHKMASGTIGIASDYTFIQSVAPRFGANACAAYLGAGVGSSSAAQLLETLLNPGQYAFDKQEGAVAYSGSTNTCAVGDPARRTIDGRAACGTNEPLDAYVMGERTYDFNVDGLAHYGLIPDLLQDVANVVEPGHADVLRRVFHSANGFIDMWERARVMSGCESTGKCAGETQIPRRDEQACGDACPCAWNQGAPLQAVDEIYGACPVGLAIRFLAKNDEGHPVFTPAEYTQRGVHVREHPQDLSQQGDWGVFPIRCPQLWECGDRPATELKCPEGTNYVKVRRVLDSTIGDVENCNWMPLPPETGNRSVVFQCLAGPPMPRANYGECAQ